MCVCVCVYTCLYIAAVNTALAIPTPDSAVATLLGRVRLYKTSLSLCIYVYLYVCLYYIYLYICSPPSTPLWRCLRSGSRRQAARTGKNT